MGQQIGQRKQFISGFGPCGKAVWRLTALLGGLFVLAGCGPVEQPLEVRRGAPQATVESAAGVVVPALSGIEGDQIALANFRGRVVLVDFWATWCAPCRAEIPELNRLHLDLQDEGFTLLGFSVDVGEPGRMAAAVSSLGVAYPTGLAGREAQQAFGGIRAVPTKFLLDKSGGVRRQYLGVVPIATLRADIMELLAE